MSDLRPSGGEGDGAAQLLASARARAAAALADLGLSEALRLTDRQRTTVARLAEALVREVEDDLRSTVAGSLAGPPELLAALSSASLRITEPADVAWKGAAARPLVALLLRRAEEHRLSRQSPDNPLLIELAGDADPRVAAEAVSLLVALSRRLDPFQEPLLAPADVPAELFHSLAWTTAAALRSYLVGTHRVEEGAADEAVSAAAATLLARHDEGEGAEALALRLARRLESEGRLDDAFVRRLAREGSLPLLLAALSLRTGFTATAVWELLGSGGTGPPLLLRAARLERQAAADILVSMAGGREETAAPQLDVFDTIAPEAAVRTLTLWRLDPAYRDALGRLAA